MKAPRIPSFIRNGKYSQNKQFHYQPRTYDEQKERLEKRRREIENEIAYEKRIKGSLKDEKRTRISESWIRREKRTQERNASRRVLLILGAIIVLIYLIFIKTDLFS
jgi:hypothetical protein